MKFSKAWLDEFLSKKIDTKQLVKQLTSAGLEVDEVSPVALRFDNIIVVEIIDVKPHPDAEPLNGCLLNAGFRKPITIVTNVASVKSTMKVPAAMVGAILPDGMKITKATLRGVESQGMFCGAETLGIGGVEDGLVELPKDAPVGKNIRDYLQLDDEVIDIELTPNRGDCLSILGIAREAALANDCEINIKKINEIPAYINNSVDIEIANPEACPCYLSRVICNIDNAALTPIWIKEKLRRSGIRSIHPVVDVTNYVMLELGQPMHAFDLASIEGGIQVRFAKNNEKLQLLDQQDVELTKNILVIADKKKVLAIAGVMGGLVSSVTFETKDIVLESAFFDPITIMGKARHYGLHTDSSHRFERGVDPQLVKTAMCRATELLVEIAGGTPGPITEQISAKHLPVRNPVLLRRERVTELLGCSIDDKQIENIFNKLAMTFEVNASGYQVIAPSHRFDIAIEADLIEELARVYGYDNIPLRMPSVSLKIQAQQPEHQFADILRALDYHEAMTYSFVDPQLQQRLTPQLPAVALSNPISPELSVMRTTLWTGLLLAAQYNANRQQTRVRLFETGLRFEPHKKDVQQIPSLAGLVMGPVVPEQWGEASKAVDFYDVKADLQALLDLTGEVFCFEQAKHSALHPGRCAKITHNNIEIGYLGGLHPELQQQLGLPAVYLFELNSLELEKLMRQTVYQPVSKFPAIRRDIALLVDDQTAIADICQAITKEAGKLLNNLIIFDVYKGEGIADSQKSIALGLVWQATERTLADDEITMLLDKVLKKLKDKHHASLRE